jgi:hypothetical protein
MASPDPIVTALRESAAALAEQVASITGGAPAGLRCLT